MLDPTDIKIIKCLQENSRESASAIGKKIKLSVSAVLGRIQRLESKGVIKHYTISLERNLIGKDVMAFISVRMEHPKCDSYLLAGVKTMPEVVECHYITGAEDYLLRIIVRSTVQLTELLEKLKELQGVATIKTMVVLSTEKDVPVYLSETEDAY